MPILISSAVIALVVTMVWLKHTMDASTEAGSTDSSEPAASFDPTASSDWTDSSEATAIDEGAPYVIVAERFTVEIPGTPAFSVNPPGVDTPGMTTRSWLYSSPVSPIVSIFEFFVEGQMATTIAQPGWSKLMVDSMIAGAASGYDGTITRDEVHEFGELSGREFFVENDNGDVLHGVVFTNGSTIVALSAGELYGTELTDEFDRMVETFEFIDDVGAS